jgi:hypothetical protein
LDSPEPVDGTSDFLVDVISAAETRSDRIHCGRPDPSPDKPETPPSIPAFPTTTNDDDRVDPPTSEDTPPSTQPSPTPMELDCPDPPQNPTSPWDMDVDTASSVGIQMPSTNIVAATIPSTDLVPVETPTADIVVYDTGNRKKKRRMVRRSPPDNETTATSAENETTIVSRQAETVAGPSTTEVIATLVSTEVDAPPVGKVSPEKEGMAKESELLADWTENNTLQSEDTGIDLLRRKIDQPSPPDNETTATSAEKDRAIVSRHTETIDLPPLKEMMATLSGKPSPKKEGTTKASENLADSAENAIAALQSDTGIDSPSQDMEIDFTSGLGKRRAEDDQKRPSGIRREKKNKKKTRKEDGSNPFFSLKEPQYKTL